MLPNNIFVMFVSYVLKRAAMPSSRNISNDYDSDHDTPDDETNFLL